MRISNMRLIPERIDVTLETIDMMLAALRAQPVDPRLAGLEPRVWARIAELQRQQPIPIVWRAAFASVAMALGAVVGGAAVSATAAPDTMAAFSVEVALAPSTLLGGRQ